MSPTARRSSTFGKDWRNTGNELKAATKSLAHAAREARPGTDDSDNELGILAEEVLDLASSRPPTGSASGLP